MQKRRFTVSHSSIGLSDVVLTVLATLTAGSGYFLNRNKGAEQDGRLTPTGYLALLLVH